jgi:hypothetical protein
LHARSAFASDFKGRQHRQPRLRVRLIERAGEDLDQLVVTANGHPPPSVSVDGLIRWTIDFGRGCRGRIDPERSMYGYTVHTGSTDKFSKGWDNIFRKKSSKRTAAKPKKRSRSGRKP